MYYFWRGARSQMMGNFHYTKPVQSHSSSSFDDLSIRQLNPSIKYVSNFHKYSLPGPERRNTLEGC